MSHPGRGPVSRGGEVPSLRVLHESVVDEEEIDALGHMNVRFYGARALASTARLLAELNVDASSFGMVSPFDYDLPRLFTRYHREQHAGSPLVVSGGLVGVGEDALRIYHELRNPERDELAASFVQDVTLRRVAEREPFSLPENMRKELSEFVVDFPGEGGPRTIDLDAPPIAPTLEEARDAGLAFRMPRRIEAEDCDAEGRLAAETRPFYMWGGDPLPPKKRSDGPSLVALADGGKMGWASMETRSVMLEPLVAGMHVQSFSATVEIARKTCFCRYWVFDLDSGRLLLANEVVELALHLGKRRAIEIPEEIRNGMNATFRPDLR